jgi:hypothetical protein
MARTMVEYFIPVQEDKSTEYKRRVRLIAHAIFLTMIFALFYVLVSWIAGYYIGLLIMLTSWFGYLILMILLKNGMNVIKVANIFGFIGAASIYGSIYFSGGFESPVLPWLASTPIVLLLIAGKKSGLFLGCCFGNDSISIWSDGLLWLCISQKISCSKRNLLCSFKPNGPGINNFFHINCI